MTIEQTVEVPPNRRITLEVPLQIPVGKAQVELKVTSIVDLENKSAPIDGKKSATPLTDALSGILSSIGDVSP